MKAWQTWMAGAVTAACLIVFVRVSAQGLWRPDAFDYAQIARELVDGRGFSSRQAIYALHLRFLHDHGLVEGDWPNLHRFPLPSVAIAAFFLIFGVSDFAVMAYGIFFQSLTAMLLFYWVRRLIGDGDPDASPTARSLRAVGPWLGPAVVAVFALNGVMLETGSSGLAEPPVLFFFTLALYLAWRLRTEPHPARFIAVGLALGLATLGRTNVLFVVPLFVLFTVGFGPWRIRSSGTEPAPTKDGLRPRLSGHRLGGQALLLVSFLLVLTPWLLRNQQVAGSPLFSLHSYFLLPAGDVIGGDKWDLSEPWVVDFISPLDYARDNPDTVMAKWRRNAFSLLRAFPRFGGTFLLPLIALLAIIVRLAPGSRPLAGLVALSFLVNALIVNFTDTYFDKYYFHLLPTLMLLAVAVVGSWVGRIPNTKLRVAVFGLATLIMADLPGILTARQRVEAKSSRFPEANMTFLRQHTSEDAVIFSDHSYAVAWETGRRSVRAYLDPRGEEPSLAVQRFWDDYLLDVDAVYLSHICLSTEPWQLALDNSRRDSRFSQRFPLEEVFPDGSILLYR